MPTMNAAQAAIVQASSRRTAASEASIICRRRATEAGAMNFVTKPVDFDALKEQLSHLRSMLAG